MNIFLIHYNAYKAIIHTIVAGQVAPLGMFLM